MSMSAFADLDRVVDQTHQAVDAFAKGDSEPLKALYSHETDVSIANPFGPPARGWQAAADTMDRAATYYRDGGATGFERMAEYATPGLAYVVEIEHFQARMGGSHELTPVTLRVTTILRPEGGTWKIVHRHADPITTARSAESVIER
jgi:ketosteroid isomerase-like protein